METALSGGRVLTVEPDHHHCWMSHKTGKDNQLWRLEDNGCLRSKHHQDRCLGLETHTTGGGVYLQEDEGIPSQQWWFVQQVRTTLHRITRSAINILLLQGSHDYGYLVNQVNERH